MGVTGCGRLGSARGGAAVGGLLGAVPTLGSTGRLPGRGDDPEVFRWSEGSSGSGDGANPSHAVDGAGGDDLAGCERFALGAVLGHGHRPQVRIPEGVQR